MNHILGTKNLTPAQVERLASVIMAIQPGLEELHRCNELVNKPDHKKTMEFGGIICCTDTVLRAAGERRSTIINEFIKFLRTI